MGTNFWEVAAYARDRGMHTSLATNGTLLTPEVVARLREIGIAYVQVSLDSTRSERHDWFRGIPGAWRRAVQGIEHAVAGKEGDKDLPDHRQPCPAQGAPWGFASRDSSCPPGRRPVKQDVGKAAVGRADGLHPIRRQPLAREVLDHA